MPHNPRLTVAREYLGPKRRYAETMLARIDAVDPMRREPSGEAVRMARAKYREVMQGPMDSRWETADRKLERAIRESLTAALAVMAGESVATESAPGHTDLMVSPESIDAFIEKYPPPDEPPAPPYLPWNRPELEGWSISGMNHYRRNGTRHLFVSMTNAPLGISAEGPDEPAVWNELAASATEAWRACNSSPALTEPPPADRPKWTAEQREAVLTAIKGLFVGVQNSMDVLTVRRVVFDTEQKFLAAFAKAGPVWPPEDCKYPQHCCHNTVGVCADPGSGCPHAGERANG